MASQPHHCSPRRRVRHRRRSACHPHRTARQLLQGRHGTLRRRRHGLRPRPPRRTQAGLPRPQVLRHPRDRFPRRRPRGRHRRALFDRPRRRLRDARRRRRPRRQQPAAPRRHRPHQLRPRGSGRPRLPGHHHRPRRAPRPQGHGIGHRRFSGVAPRSGYGARHHRPGRAPGDSRRALRRRRTGRPEACGHTRASHPRWCQLPRHGAPDHPRGGPGSGGRSCALRNLRGGTLPMSRRPPAKPSTKSGSRAAAQGTEPARWQLRLPPGFFLFLAVTAFYVWTATSSQYAFKWGTRKIDHYNLLAEGFLSGHLYLAQSPPKEMLALKDPLDPVANGPYRLHDASLYQGRYYVYFGPVPALTLYSPWRAIPGWGIPNNLAVITYLLVGYLFSCLLLFLLLDAAGIRPSWILRRAAIAALGLCQIAPIILRRAYLYETAVAAGFCFFIAGMYFLGRHALAEKPRMWHAVLAGLFLGMTPGCRPNYAVVAVLVIGGYLAYLWRSRRVSDRALLNQVFALGAAFAFCGLLLAWYNFARFGNPLETGQNYQLIGNIADRGITSKSSNFLPGLYRFLVEAPIWSRHFPFLELPTRGSFGATEWPAGTDYIEPIVGLLMISPLCLAGLLFPLYVHRWKRSIPDAVRLILMLLYLAALANLVT